MKGRAKTLCHYPLFILFGVIEQASRTIRAVHVLVKLEARLGPVLAIDDEPRLHFILPMSKTALHLVGAVPSLQPILAHLSLVLVLVWNAPARSQVRLDNYFLSILTVRDYAIAVPRMVREYLLLLLI